VREYVDGYSYVEASPITGRTHQLRVHFASLGHPIVGDTVYGKASKLVSRQFLHSWRLTFRHPITGEELSFEAPLAADLQTALAQLGVD
jgi:23S rRNA pseudouridine1911/1915/1917 synthase